jgi:hypothetical protein
MRLLFVLLPLGCLLAEAGPGAGDDVPKPDLQPFVQDVRELVEKHYPRANVTLKDQTIHFEFNTRKFMIHEPTRVGDKWQDAREELGPDPSGIHCDMELRQGPYRGAAVARQSFDKRYFTLLLLAPYSKKLDHHLYVQLKYPRDVHKEFLKEFERLVDGFEKHVPTGLGK